MWLKQPPSFAQQSFRSLACQLFGHFEAVCLSRKHLLARCFAVYEDTWNGAQSKPFCMHKCSLSGVLQKCSYARCSG